MLIKKILVALDGSGESEKALEFAVDFAKVNFSEVQLITVVPPVFLPTYAYSVLKSRLISDCQKELEAKFNGYLRKAQSYVVTIKPDLIITTKLSSGFPHEEIVRTARIGNFDLIIMGSRGLGGKLSFQESVSSRVIDEAPCPVLVIKRKGTQPTIKGITPTKQDERIAPGLSA